MGTFTRRRRLLQTTGTVAVGSIVGFANLPRAASRAGVAERADGPTVYVGSRAERVFAVDARSGTEQWRYTASAVDWGGSPAHSLRFSSPLIVADGTVFARVSPVDDGGWQGPAFLVAVDAETGDVRWRQKFEAPSWFTAPTIADGRVYLGTVQPRLDAVDVATGDRSWTVSDRAGRYGIVGVADGTVYAPRSGGQDWFDANSGAEIDPALEYPRTEGPVEDRSPPIVVEGTLYHGGVAWDVDSGAVLWAHDAPVYWSTLAGGTRYLSVRDGGVVAIETATGDVRWTFDDVDNAGAVTSAEGLVYTVGDGTLYAIDDDSGTGEWQFGGDGEMRGHPAVFDGLVYVGSTAGVLYALDAVTGDREWAFDKPMDAVGSPTVTVDPDGGSSVDTRALQGPTGHHDELAHPMEGYESPRVSEDDDAEDEGNAIDAIPGFGGLAATTGLAGGGYLAARRGNRAESEE